MYLSVEIISYLTHVERNTRAMSRRTNANCAINWFSAAGGPWSPVRVLHCVANHAKLSSPVCLCWIASYCRSCAESGADELPTRHYRHLF
jgi:hypothetical protein